ncbi:MAG: ABC transporter substrate-binding protein, partial [Synergistaceae bacterium]|nr:ABC transporter substrate-binding protein [Synergistaceae bacterium]
MKNFVRIKYFAHVSAVSLIFTFFLPFVTPGHAVIFVDDLNREIDLPLPIERAAVANRYNNELIRAIGAGNNVVAVDQYTSQDSVYWSKFGPETTFGRDEYNYEMLTGLGPQVLILPKNGRVEEAAEKLKPFGIEVVVITGWDNAGIEKQIRLAGRLFGREKEAEDLAAFYRRPVEYIESKLEGVKEKKTVYWEYGDDYSTCIPGTSNDGWHNMILM